MITIFHSALSETLKDLAKYQNNTVRIPLTVYFDRVEEFKFSTGYTVHTLEPVKVSVRDYYWINKPPKPMMYRTGYYINKKELPFLTVFSFGYKMKFSDEFYLKVRSPYKRRFFFGDRLNAHYRAGYKVRLGYTQFKNTYRTGYKVKNFKSDEFILNYKFPYIVERIGTFNIRLSTGYNVHLISQEEYTYRFWYRNSVSKFIFPRRYNQNAAGANTSIAELIKPWKVIKQKDGTSGIRISLDKEKLDLGSDGLRIYLNMPPKYINYCVLLRQDSHTDSKLSISEYVTYGDIPFTAEDNDGMFLYIPSVIPTEGSATGEKVSEFLKTTSPISISLYRYNSNPVDTTTIIRGEKWVDEKVYDPGVLYNLEAKKIDIKEESIVLSESTKRGLDSDSFEAKFSEANSCCLDKPVLTKDSAESCTITRTEVEYRVTGGNYDPSVICSRIEAKDFIDSLNSIGVIIGVQDGFNVGGIEWWMIDAGKVTDKDGNVVRYPDQFATTQSYDFNPGDAFKEDNRQSDIKVVPTPPSVSQEFDPREPSKVVPEKPKPLSTDDEDNRRFTNLDFVRDPYLPGFRP